MKSCCGLRAQPECKIIDHIKRALKKWCDVRKWRIDRWRIMFALYPAEAVPVVRWPTSWPSVLPRLIHHGAQRASVGDWAWKLIIANSSSKTVWITRLGLRAPTVLAQRMAVANFLWLTEHVTHKVEAQRRSFIPTAWSVYVAFLGKKWCYLNKYISTNNATHMEFDHVGGGNYVVVVVSVGRQLTISSITHWGLNKSTSNMTSDVTLPIYRFVPLICLDI